jgi:Zn-dependent M28 family amino/carboxypeptidase
MKKLLKVLAAGMLSLASGCVPLGGTDALDSLQTNEMVDQVSQTSYQNYLDNSLCAHIGQSRFSDTDQHNTVRDNIEATFKAIGLNTTVDTFIDAYGRTSWNIVGELPGTTRPNDIYIVGAHYDTAYQDSIFAPGADDNASGVAGVLETARVMAGYQYGATLRFIAFDREESYMNGEYEQGSRYYASSHAEENILGMISLDMIAHSPDDNAGFSSGNRTLKNAIDDAVTAYGQGIKLTLYGKSSVSDHAPFEEMGFAAGMLIEDSENDRYHKANDAMGLDDGYIDYDFATKITRSAVGFLAGKAVPLTSE